MKSYINSGAHERQWKLEWGSGGLLGTGQLLNKSTLKQWGKRPQLGARELPVLTVIQCLNCRAVERLQPTTKLSEWKEGRKCFI